MKTKKNCVNCNTKFLSIGKQHRFCCNICCNKYHSLKYKFPHKFPKKICLVCDKSFQTKYTNQKYCSVECRNKTTKIEYYGEKNNYYSFYLKIRFEIFKRDNFTCQYCGRNPKEDGCKLHADHIIPKSKGGKYNFKNLITSCAECNEGKKDILLNERNLKKLKLKNDSEV